MRTPSRKIVGFVLVFVVVFSAYLTIVEIIDTFKPDGILKSFSLKSLRRSGSSGKFLMGDTLVIEAKSDVASECDLQVYANSSMVFESEGGGRSSLKFQVPLVSPAFTVGKSYTLSLNGFVVNSPIPGAFFRDSASYTFEVASTQTKLGLVSVYDDVMKSVYAYANLTDLDGYPVINETVSFAVQLKSEDPLTDGWIPLGSSVTDDNGTAKLSVGLNIPFADQMSLKACHVGNADFGACENTTDVEVISDFSESLLYMPFSGCNAARTRETRVFDVGTVSISTNVTSPYALLGVNVTASYNSSMPLTGDFNVMVFFVDSIDRSALVSEPNLISISEGAFYVYRATFIWGPRVVGFHTLIAGVVSGSGSDIIRAQNGTGIIASGNKTFNISPCPSNLVLHLPEAVYGNLLPIGVAFSKAWPYAANDGGGFTACSLAPQFTYDGVSYAIGTPVNASVPVSLYVNGTQIGTPSMTDVDGLASFLYSLAFSGSYSSLSINCTTNCSGLLFQVRNASRGITFTSVNVSDTLGVGGNVFKLNCVVNGQGVTYGLGNGTICVGTGNLVDLTAKLNDSSVWGAPASVLIGKPIARACTNGSGWVSTANCSSCLRVASLFDLGTTTALAPAFTTAADINHDGSVDGKDLSFVAKAFGTSPGSDPRWNWRADLNFDMKSDGKDTSLVAHNFGKNVTYLNVADCSGVKASFLVNGQLNVAFLDCSGCAPVPFNASGLNFSLGVNPVGAVVEFFNCTFHQACSTDNAGESVTSWTPPETGDCSGSSISTGKVRLKGYMALAWLPPSFQATISKLISFTSVQDQLVNVTYVNVVKRPVSMSVGYAPSQPTLDDMVNMSATCIDEALGAPASGLNVGFYLSNLNGSYICMGASNTNDSGVATFSWNPRYYQVRYGLPAYFVVRVLCNETDFTQMVEVVPVAVDTRYPTALEFLGGPVVQMVAGAEYDLAFNLTRSDTGTPVPNVDIDVCMNDTIHYPYHICDDGTSSGPWSGGFSQSGVYFFKASFVGDMYFYRPSNETRFVVVASAAPIMVVFDVEPHEFEPGSDITLIATVLNATSQDPLPGFRANFYEVSTDGTSLSIGSGTTNASGVATRAWPYKPFGVYAYTVLVAGGQQMMTSPVMLTGVGKETGLMLNVSMGSDYNHVVSGYLVSDGARVGSKPVEVYVNNALKANVTTSGVYGNFSVTLNLPAVSSMPTSYNVQAMFEGDNPCNATAYAYTPNGTQYALCTTIQYGYKPSSNSTFLTVEPQATQLMTTTRTPKQMQKDAEQNGTLRIWNEFSWWFPWYRFHMVYVLSGVDQFDVGIGLLGSNILKAFQDFTDRIVGYARDMVPDLFSDYVLGEMVAAVGAMTGNLVAWAIAAGISVGVKLYLLYGESWNSLEKLHTSYVAQFVSLMIEVSCFIAEFSLGHLIDIASNLMKFSSAVWAVLTLIANILLDLTFFFNIVDMRISELGGQ